MYSPQPLDTSTIVLPEHLSRLCAALAANNHEIWARERFRHGWTFGPTRNDERKEHPCLVPWSQLTREERVVDYEMAEGLLKTLYALGYEVRSVADPEPVIRQERA